MPDNSIQLFSNPQFGDLRIFQENGEPWFVAKDVAITLGYRDSYHMTRNLDDDEKGTRNVGTLGGKQGVSVINEAGFYHAVMQRRAACVNDEASKKAVVSFQRWVTHEVLPSIRRDGGYMAARPDETPEQIMARALKVADETIKRQKRQIEELEPKALFADAVAASDGTCLVGQLAKMMRQNGIEIGQNRLFAWMRKNGYPGKYGQNYNIPSQRYVEQGLFRLKETAITHSDGHVSVNITVKVTGKGTRYFLDKALAGEIEVA